MPKALRAAREKADKAKADVRTKWQQFEAAQRALANAEIPAEGSMDDMAEVVAAETAKTEYETAAEAAEQADADVARIVAALSTDDKPAPFAGAPAVHTSDYGPEETQGFKTLGEFVHAVAFDRAKLAKHGVQEIHAEQTTSGEAADGGFPLPTLFSQQLLELPFGSQIVRGNNATVIPAGGVPDAELKILALNQVGAGNQFGGVQIVWGDEEIVEDIPGSSAKVVPYVSLKAKSVRGLVEETNKVIRNHAWSTPLLQRKMASALYNSEDFEFLSGTAADRPTGVRSCPGMIYLNRKLASKVVWEDILAMKARMIPESHQVCVFVAHASLYPQLRDLKDVNGDRVYFVGDPTKGIADTLDGRPVIYTGKVAAPGSKGDLILVDFSYYLIKDGMDVLISTSEHVKFKSDRTVIKINRSVDGKGWITGPLTLEDGSTTVSPFIGLDVPTG